MQSIGQRFEAGPNNFNAIRLAGAALVLFSHSYVLTGHGSDELIAALLGGASDGGRIAVAMFFVVSGFLVSRSVMAHRPLDYARARLLRVWPGFAAVVAAQTLILGPLFTTLPTATYFTDPATWLALGRGLLFNPRLGLPGVFAGNPFPDAVNGSLWTLRIEVLCYLWLLVASRTGLLDRRVLTLLAILSLVLVAASRVTPGHDGPAWRLLTDPRVVAILACCVQFLMGALIWVWRDRIPCSAVLVAACLLALLLLGRTALAPVAFQVIFPYLVICAGLAPAVGEGGMRRLGDISYGTYLYAFPVQQALVDRLGPLDPVALAGLASLPVFVLAWLSRRYVEAPALRLKTRFSGAAAGVRVPAGEGA